MAEPEQKYWNPTRAFMIVAILLFVAGMVVLAVAL